MASKSAQAAFVAKKGMEMLFSATKGGVSAVATGISRARQHYKSYHEKDVIESLQKSGVPPAELLYQAVRRFYFLTMAGYKHEVTTAAQQAAKRMLDVDKSSIPLDVVAVMGRVMTEEMLRFGDFRSGGLSQSMSEFLNTGGASKDHADRDSIARDLYYAVLLVVEAHGVAGPGLESVFQESIRRVMQDQVPAGPPPPAYPKSPSSARLAASPQPSAPPFYDAGQDPFMASAPPLYPTLDSSRFSQSSAASSAVRPAESDSLKAAKGLYAVATTLKKAADDAEMRRQKQLRDAEAMLKAEQTRLGAPQSLHAHH